MKPPLSTVFRRSSQPQNLYLLATAAFVANAIEFHSNTVALVLSLLAAMLCATGWFLARVIRVVMLENAGYRKALESIEPDALLQAMERLAFEHEFDKIVREEEKVKE